MFEMQHFDAPGPLFTHLVYISHLAVFCIAIGFYAGWATAKRK